MLEYLAMIEGEDVASDQWRICRPYRRLGQLGMPCSWAVSDHALGRRTDPALTVLVAARKMGQSIEVTDRWFAAHRPKVRAIIYECDDLMFDTRAIDFLADARFLRGMSREEFAHQVEMARSFAAQCDGITVSSDGIAEVARSFTDKPVVVIPNALDVRWFRAQLAPKALWAAEGIVTIGWAGSVRPADDLAPMLEAWERIARRYSHVRFVVSTFGQTRFLFRSVEHKTTFVDWRAWDDYPMAYQVDIGCCAVADTPFNRAKTPIKAWEYAAAGAAVVATPTLYGDCCVWTGSGLVAELADEWESALVHFIEMPDSRVSAARCLAQHVEYGHALDRCVERWTDAYATILARQPSPA